MTSLDETRPAASDRSQRGGIRSGFAARLQTKQPRRQSWGIASIALCVSMAAIWLVAIPLAFAPPARAQSGTVLILSTSVNGGTSSPEAEAATADGYSVTVDTPSTWDSLTEANFASYSAIVIGDPSNGSSRDGGPLRRLKHGGDVGPGYHGRRGRCGHGARVRRSKWDHAHRRRDCLRRLGERYRDLHLAQLRVLERKREHGGPASGSCRRGRIHGPRSVHDLSQFRHREHPRQRSPTTSSPSSRRARSGPGPRRPVR